MNTLSMLLGNIRGTIGETSVVAIMIGAMFLILMGVIDLRIPGTYIVTFVILSHCLEDMDSILSTSQRIFVVVV